MSFIKRLFPQRAVIKTKLKCVFAHDSGLSLSVFESPTNPQPDTIKAVKVAVAALATKRWVDF